MSVYKTVMFIHDALQGQRLVLQNEKVLQAQISEIFKKSGLQFVPEHRLDEKKVTIYLLTLRKQAKNSYFKINSNF